MRLKRCKRCGKDYNTDKPGAYYCPDCALQARRESVVRPRTCCQCGAEFLGGPRARYCPTCRQVRQRQSNAKYKRSGASRPLGSTSICERCGVPYMVQSGQQRYCKDCAEEAVKESVRPHKRAYNQANKDILYPYKEAMRSGCKVCVVCGKTFDAPTARMTCSEECAKEQRRRVQAAADQRRGPRKRPPAHERYTSGLPQSDLQGVTYHRQRRKWQVVHQGKYVGLFPSKEEAEAVKKRLGEQDVMLNDE